MSNALQTDFSSLNFSLLTNDLREIFILLKNIILTEFLEAIHSAIFVNRNKQKNHKDFVDYLTMFINCLLFVPFIYACYFITALALNIADLISILSITVFYLLQAPLGMIINIAHLLLNNLIVHALVLGIIKNALVFILCAPFCLLDPSARKEIITAVSGLKLGCVSLWLALCALLHPVSLMKTMLGEMCLIYVSEPYLDNASLITSNDKSTYFFGLNMSIFEAMNETKALLRHQFHCLKRDAEAALVTPFLIVTSGVKSLLSGVAFIEKTTLSVPLSLLSFACNNYAAPTKGRAKHSDTHCKPLS